MPPHQKTTDQAASDKQRGTEQAGFFTRHEWTLVGLLATLAAVLGCIGFANTMTFASEGGPNTWWDVVYSSFRMFIFEAPEETAGSNPGNR